MLKVMVLGSGSAGNAVLVAAPGASLLVDAGLSARQLAARMAMAGIEPGSLDAILLSHEHGDHTRGLEVFCRQHGVPVYCNRHTQRVVAETMRCQPSWRLVEAGTRFSIGSLSLESFQVPHDAVDPMGFSLSWQEETLAVLTDLGHPTTLVLDKARGAQTVVLEANYDDVLLANDTRRPWATKQRIASRHGHLSNAQAAEVVRHLLPHGLRRVVLAHLSRDCNNPETACRHIRGVAQESGASLDVYCAVQDEPTPWVGVGGALSEMPA